jgi:hypothetical protein
VTAEGKKCWQQDHGAAPAGPFAGRIGSDELMDAGRSSTFSISDASAAETVDGRGIHAESATLGGVEARGLKVIAMGASNTVGGLED